MQRLETTSREYGHLHAKCLTISSGTGEFSATKSKQENKFKLIKIVRDCCKYIDGVNFTRDCMCIFNTMEVVNLLSLCCPKLKRLDAEYMMVSNSNWINLVKGCPNLEELILADTSLWKINEDQLGEFFSGAKCLKRFCVKDEGSMTSTDSNEIVF